MSTVVVVRARGVASGEDSLAYRTRQDRGRARAVALTGARKLYARSRTTNDRHRRDATASAAKAFWRSQTDRGLPTGTIALRRRGVRVGLTTLSLFVGESAFGFASDVAGAFRCGRGSMFSLFSSSQLAYARCRGKLLVFLPGLPAFRVAHGLAASGPIFHLRCARTAGSGPFFTRARTVGGQLSVRATVFKRPPTRPRERRVRTALWMVSDALVSSRTGSAQVGGT